MGPRDEISEELFEKEGIKVKKIITGKIRRYSGAILQNAIDLIFKIPLGIIQSFLYVFFLSPDLIFSKGGYGAFPATISAKILQTPLFLHESDIAPGAVNKKTAGYALEIFTSFPKTEFFSPEKMILVGNPIRKSLTENIEENRLKEKIGLEKRKPVILIIGGSQGSERMNDLVLSILPHILSDFQVIHQCGARNFKKIVVQTNFLIKKDQKKNYHLFSFLTEEQLKYAYYAADLVVSRAGSASIFEIAAFGKPSILIPLPESAYNHQAKNAYFYSDFEAALVVEEKNITSNLFIQEIFSVLKNNKTMREMKEKAQKFSKPRSAEIIAGYIIEFLKQQ